MSDIKRETEINLVVECLEILGLKLLADCVRASEGTDLQGYAEIVILEAEKKAEHFIVEKMRSLICGL